MGARGQARSAASPSAASGFTLIEILVALMIAGVGLATVAGLMSSGLSLSASAERVTRETALARSALARFGADLPVVPGELTEEMAEGYRWRSDIVRLEPDAPAGTLQTARVTVTVWHKSENDPGVRLSTIRLLPPPREALR